MPLKDYEASQKRVKELTTIILRVETDKPVADLLDKIAGRAYTIDGVADVTANSVDSDAAAKVVSQLIDLAYGK